MRLHNCSVAGEAGERHTCLEAWRTSSLLGGWRAGPALALLPRAGALPHPACPAPLSVLRHLSASPDPSFRLPSGILFILQNPAWRSPSLGAFGFPPVLRQLVVPPAAPFSSRPLVNSRYLSDTCHLASWPPRGAEGETAWPWPWRSWDRLPWAGAASSVNALCARARCLRTDRSRAAGRSGVRDGLSEGGKESSKRRF